MLTDVQAIYRRDLAARNWLEVLLCYPGLQALWLHRLAHQLHCFKVPFLPRLISQINRFVTGIEIHPGARIGRGVFIDHGMGVVIGETAIMGDYATIYQDVTLGGTGKETGKRHPTLGKNVVVGAGAKVLGNIHIGENVRIGAASVVLRDAPSDCTVVGIPGRISLQKSDALDALGHSSLRDIEAEVIQALFQRVKALEEQMEQLKPLSNPRSLGQVEPAQSNAMIEEFLNGAGI
ncbi:MAG: serine O-acetyltransferase [Phormidium tanganyikae FI6-MK23]|jgi:serine O-acetyltransferase|nr:serine O-acetyltransferase [Phormidium tanganyikae FI6-MK23]